MEQTSVSFRGFIRRCSSSEAREDHSSSSRRSEGCGSVTKRRRGGGGGIIGENKLGMLAMEEPLISFLQYEGLPPFLTIHPVARTAPQPLSYLPGTGQGRAVNESLFFCHCQILL